MKTNWVPLLIIGVVVYALIRKKPEGVAASPSDEAAGAIASERMVLMRDAQGTQGQAWIFPADVPAYLAGGWELV